MRQTNVMDMYAADPELLERSSPIRRQLLGAMGDNSPPMPSPGAAKHWAAEGDQIPLREWAESHARPGVPFDWGLGKGAPYNINGSSTAMSHAMGITEEEVRQMVVADFMPSDSPGYANDLNHEMLPAWRTEIDGDRLYQPSGLVGAVDTREDAAAIESAIKVVRSVLPELSPGEAATALGEHRGDVRGALRELLARL